MDELVLRGIHLWVDLAFQGGGDGSAGAHGLDSSKMMRNS